MVAVAAGTVAEGIQDLTLEHDIADSANTSQSFERTAVLNISTYDYAGNIRENLPKSAKQVLKFPYLIGNLIVLSE